MKKMSPDEFIQFMSQSEDLNVLSALLKPFGNRTVKSPTRQEMKDFPAIFKQHIKKELTIKEGDYFDVVRALRIRVNELKKTPRLKQRSSSQAASFIRGGDFEQDGMSGVTSIEGDDTASTETIEATATRSSGTSPEEEIPGFLMTSNNVYITIPEEETNLLPYRNKLIDFNRQGILHSLTIENCTPTQLDDLLSSSEYGRDESPYWTSSGACSLVTLNIIKTRSASDSSNSIASVVQRALEKNRSVMTLGLNASHLDDHDIFRLGILCLLNQTIRSLDLSNNDLRDEHEEAIAILIYHAQALENINLTNNAFEPGGHGEDLIYAAVQEREQEKRPVHVIGLSPPVKRQREENITQAPVKTKTLASSIAREREKPTELAPKTEDTPMHSTRKHRKEPLPSFGESGIYVKCKTQSDRVYTIDLNDQSKTLEEHVKFLKTNQFIEHIKLNHANADQIAFLLLAMNTKGQASVNPSITTYQSSRQSLKAIELIDCHSSAEQTVMDVIESQLPRLPQVNTLILNHALSGRAQAPVVVDQEELTKLNQCLQQYPQISSLALPNNQLRDVDLERIPHVRNCKRLDLSSNALEGPGILRLLDEPTQVSRLILHPTPVTDDDHASMQFEIESRIDALDALNNQHTIECYLPAVEAKAVNTLIAIQAKKDTQVAAQKILTQNTIRENKSKLQECVNNDKLILPERQNPEPK